MAPPAVLLQKLEEFRAGSSYGSLRTWSLPLSPMTATPKQMPHATSPKISAPCNACTRGLFKLVRSTSTPSRAIIRPVNRLLRFMQSPRSQSWAAPMLDNTSPRAAPYSQPRTLCRKHLYTGEWKGASPISLKTAGDYLRRNRQLLTRFNFVRTLKLVPIRLKDLRVTIGVAIHLLGDLRQSVSGLDRVGASCRCTTG